MAARRGRSGDADFQRPLAAGRRGAAGGRAMSALLDVHL
jgi:hypothetical protein